MVFREYLIIFPHQHTPFLLSPYICPFSLLLYFPISISHRSPHTYTLYLPLFLSPSPVNQPCTTTFGGFHRRTPLETPYTPFSQSFKGKTLNCLVAFQVFLKFLSNLSYMSGIHAIEYMGF